MHSFSLPIKCVTKTKLIYAIKTDNRAVSEGGGGVLTAVFHIILRFQNWNYG